MAAYAFTSHNYSSTRIEALMRSLVTSAHVKRVQCLQFSPILHTFIQTTRRPRIMLVSESYYQRLKHQSLGPKQTAINQMMYPEKPELTHPMSKEFPGSLPQLVASQSFVQKVHQLYHDSHGSQCL